METVLIIASIGIMNILCFFIGARVGQKVIRQEKIELNPIKAINKAKEENREKKEKELEDEYIKTIMHNIDNYNGTSLGQKDIPSRK